MTATDVVEAAVVIGGPDHLATPDPGEPAWEWRTEYLHEIED